MKNHRKPMKIQEIYVAKLRKAKKCIQSIDNANVCVAARRFYLWIFEILMRRIFKGMVDLFTKSYKRKYYITTTN